MFNKTASTPTNTPTTSDPMTTGGSTDTAVRSTAPSYPSQADAAQKRPSATSRTPSLLGPDIVFEGTITGEGELHVEGTVRGEVQVARLLIGERAQVEGAVRGQHIEVRGRVAGNIEAKMVKLYESAHVEGDIVHEQLSIDVGAYFTGRCQVMKKPAPQPVVTPVAAKEEPAATPAPAAAAAAASKPANGKVVDLDKSPTTAVAN